MGWDARSLVNEKLKFITMLLEYEKMDQTLKSSPANLKSPELKLNSYLTPSKPLSYTNTKEHKELKQLKEILHLHA